MEHQQLQYEADGSNAEPTNANYGGFSQQVSFDFCMEPSEIWFSGTRNYVGKMGSKGKLNKAFFSIIFAKFLAYFMIF